MRISIAMCTYNGSEYIREQLESILNQTVSADEIVVYDDCSSDDTVSILHELLDDWNGQVKIVENAENVRIGKAFLACIKLCTGDLIFTADQDDVWLPQKIEKMIEPFKNPECVLAVCDGYVTDKDLNVVCESNWDAIGAYEAGFKGCDTSSEALHTILMYHWLVNGNMMCFRKSFSDKVLPYPVFSGWIHDSWLGIIAPEYGTCSFIEEKLIYYRQHGNNICGSNNNYTKNKKEKEIFHIQHVLFHLEHHANRLNRLLEARQGEIGEDVRNKYMKYIQKYNSISTYQQSSNLKKMLFLFRFVITGELKMFNITRKQVIEYIMFLLKR